MPKYVAEVRPTTLAAGAGLVLDTPSTALIGVRITPPQGAKLALRTARLAGLVRPAYAHTRTRTPLAVIWLPGLTPLEALAPSLA